MSDASAAAIDRLADAIRLLAEQVGALARARTPEPAVENAEPPVDIRPAAEVPPPDPAAPEVHPADPLGELWETDPPAANRDAGQPADEPPVPSDEPPAARPAGANTALPVAASAVPIVTGSLPLPAAVVAVATGPDDPRFEIVHRLYRKWDGVLRVIRPAELVGDAIARRGELQLATSAKPPLTEFAAQEQAALTAELRAGGRPHRFADGRKHVPATPELVHERLRTCVVGLQSATDGNSPHERAQWFARFTQIVLNVFLRDSPDAGRWNARQKEFLAGASEYFGELNLQEIVAVVGRDYTQFKDYTPVGYTPAQNEGRETRGQVLQVLARALRYTPTQARYNGTLLYMA